MIRWITVATLLLLPQAAAAGILRCEVNGHIIYTNLRSHCPSSGAAVPSRHVATTTLKPAARQMVKKSGNTGRRISQLDWWSLLGGPSAPGGMHVVANKLMNQQGVTLAYASTEQLHLLRALVADRGKGLVLPALTEQAVAGNMRRRASSMQMQRVEIAPYRPELFAGYRKRGFVQVPAPIFMVIIHYRTSAGKAKLWTIPVGRALGRLYLSMPYQRARQPL